MSRTLKVYSGEDQTPITDITDMVEWPESEFAQRAHLGESTLSNLRFRDEDGRVGDSASLPAGLTPISLNAHNVVIWTESGATMGRFRISPKDWTRGAQVAGRAREATVTLEDYNADLRNIVVHDYSRPAETDVARVQGVLASYLSGSPRRTTNFNGSNLVSGSNTVSLPATTYNRTNTAEVLASIAAAANKQYFVTIDAQLFYDGNDSTAYSSPFKISDRDTDLSSTVFAPQPGGFGPASSEDGQQLLSGIWLFYGESQYVTVRNPTVANQNSWWEDVVYDDTVTDAAQATVVANAILAQRQTEERQIAVRIGPLEVGQAILLKVGQLIQIKWRAIPHADDAYVTRRITELRWSTPEPFSFFADMILDRPTKFHGQGQKIDTVIPKPAPEAVPDILGATIFHWTWTTHEQDDESNTYHAGLQRITIAFDGIPANHGRNDASNFLSEEIPASANTAYGFSCKIAWKYDPTIRDVDIQWRDVSSTILRTDRWITGAGHATFVAYDESATFTSPAGTVAFTFKWSNFAGQKVDDLFFSTAGTITADDEFALTDPGSSPYFARSDDPRFTADNQHLIERLSRRMTNNSGVALVAEDVVVPDLTLENAVTRTTTANTTASMVGVVIEGAADDAEVVVMWQGSIVSVSSTDTTPTAGDYLFTSTTAGKVQTSATRAAGAVGRIISVDGTEQTTVLWWGVPDSGGAGVTADTIWDAKGDLAAGTGADTAAKLTVGANDTVLMADSAQSTGLKWVASQTPSTQVFGDAAAEGTADTYSRGDHKHAMPADPIDAASSKASGTGDITTTATAADATGATLSLAAGTYIVIGSFDVTRAGATNDRTFEGVLDVGGTDENDLALWAPLGAVLARAPVVQGWRVVLASTTTVKLQARHSGGTAGDFTVNGANTTISAYRAGGDVSDPAWTSFTPTWTAPTTNPAIGNGTLSGAYLTDGKTHRFRILMTAGSTTTYGSGRWDFGLGGSVSTVGMGEQVVACHMVDASTGTPHGGGAWIPASATPVVRPTPAGSGTINGISSTVPWTWASGDAVRMEGVIQVA